MASNLVIPNRRAGDTRLSPGWSEIESLLAAARRIRDGGRPLAGGHLAIVEARGGDRSPDPLVLAAEGAGLTVARVRLDDAVPTDGDSDAILHLLGRLYEAFDCRGIDPDGVARIARTTGRPVFDDLGSDRHRVRGLADLLTLADHRQRHRLAASVALSGPIDSDASRAFAEGARGIGWTVCRIDPAAPAATTDPGAATIDGVAGEPAFRVEVGAAEAVLITCRAVPIGDAARQADHLAMLRAVLAGAIER